jgi:hypothetical protein
MTLKDLKIGDRFKLSKKGVVWIKETEQGMDNHVSYCRTEIPTSTRCRGGRKSYRNRLFYQSQQIFEKL